MKRTNIRWIYCTAATNSFGPNHSLNRSVTKLSTCNSNKKQWSASSDQFTGENYYPPLLPELIKWLADVYILFCWLLDQLFKLVRSAVSCFHFLKQCYASSKNLERCVWTVNPNHSRVYSNSVMICDLYRQTFPFEGPSHAEHEFLIHECRNPPVSYEAAAHLLSLFVPRHVQNSNNVWKVCSDSPMTESDVTPCPRCWQIPICQSHPPRYSCCFNAGTSCSFCWRLNTIRPQSLPWTRKLPWQVFLFRSTNRGGFLLILILTHEPMTSWTDYNTTKKNQNNFFHTSLD